MCRTFFALWPNAEVRGQLRVISSEVPADWGRHVVEANLHITLNFIGNVQRSRLPDILLAAEHIKLKPFELVLDHIGYFARTRVVWLGASIIPDELTDLFRQLSKALRKMGFKMERRPYKPHITLMRKARPPAYKVEFMPVSWNVASFVLIESKLDERPVRYQLIKEYRVDE